MSERTLTLLDFFFFFFFFSRSRRGKVVNVALKEQTYLGARIGRIDHSFLPSIIM